MHYILENTKPHTILSINYHVSPTTTIIDYQSLFINIVLVQNNLFVWCLTTHQHK